jgi:hypothetical protein
MFHRTPILTTALLTAAVAVPSVAGAAVHLGGAPTLKQTDATHAKLHFASDKLPAKGVRITFAGGQKVSGLKADGTHGSDVTYVAKVTSRTAMVAGHKYTVTIKVPGQAPIVRKVKLRG